MGEPLIFQIVAGGASKKTQGAPQNFGGAPQNLTNFKAWFIKSSYAKFYLATLNIPSFI